MTCPQCGGTMCSTPYGITARSSGGERSQRGGVDDVLNALRHHS